MSHRPVRSLTRGLALIRELNVTGPSSAQQIAGRTGLNRTTCYRLLQTLQQDGFVSFDEENALFSLTARIRMLSEGVSTRDLSSQAALPRCSPFSRTCRGRAILRCSNSALW